MSNTGSQASQDQFVFGVTRILDKLYDTGMNHTYVEIGANHPVELNNTWKLELDGWNGVSIDNSSAFSLEWAKKRTNQLVIANAVSMHTGDWVELLARFSKFISYLSLDIDEFTAAVLTAMPLADHRFEIITIEHDAYRFGDQLRTPERELLAANGYIMVAADVNGPEFPFEDWWLDKDVQARLKLPLLANKHHDEIIRTWFGKDANAQTD